MRSPNLKAAMPHLLYAKLLVLIAVSLIALQGCGDDSDAPPSQPPQPPQNQAPVADVSASCTDLTCNVDASASSDADGTIQSYSWDFGDGVTATGATATHAYSAAGQFDIIVTVTDDDGASATATQGVTITAANVDPVAAFSGTCTDLSCDFDASASADSDGTIASFGWDFGDSSIGTGMTTNHDFAADGDYTVVLTITDNDGATSTNSQQFTVSAPALVQLGDTIQGVLASDLDGRVVDISDDGSRVVLGTVFGDADLVNGGQVRVFEWDGSAWTQLGQTLADPAATINGWGAVHAVSLSGDGQRVAIGHSLTSNTDSSRGAVWVYEWDGSQWTQLGTTVTAQVNVTGRLGITVALSTDGSRFAAGAHMSNATVNGVEGAFVVYEFAGGAWSRLGNTVFGTQPGEQLGTSIDISGNGNRVVVGAPGYTVQNSNAMTIVAGRALVFDWTGSDWSQVAGAVVGRTDDAAGIRLGQSVAISQDGSRFATFGNSSGDRVRVFELAGSDWAQMGPYFVMSAAFDLHQPMSLTQDGGRIALGGPFAANSGNNNGQLAIYDWNGTGWDLYAPEVYGDNQSDHLGWSVSITPDGSRAVAGMPGWDGENIFDRGGARVYDIR